MSVAFMPGSGFAGASMASILIVRTVSSAEARTVLELTFVRRDP
jgi:hypothetical protein